MSVYSLFPAYASSSTSEAQNDSKEGLSKEWLENPSFEPDLIHGEPADEERNSSEKHSSFEDDIIEHKPPSKRRKRHKRRKKQETSENLEVIHGKLESKAHEESIQSQLKKLVFIEDTGLSLERAYRLDASCDYDNYALGCLDRMHIARYFPMNKIPFGLTVHELLTWPKEKAKKKSKRNHRYFSYIGKTTSQKHTLSLMHSDSIYLPDYVPISTTSEKEYLNNSSVTNNFDGVSVQWKAHILPESSLSKLAIDSTENFPAIPLPEQEINEKTAAFNKRLKEHSEDEHLWLDFVSFQDDVYRVLSCYKNTSSLEQSIFEKKISILDKALENNPSSLKLKFVKLELCKGYWDNDKLLSCWEDLLFLHPNDTHVWNQYLMFVLSSFSSLTIPRVVKLYKKCLKTLKSIQEGHFLSHAASPDILKDIVDIFSQLCYILLESGYNERALAFFQAIMEFNLFFPTVDHSLSCEDWVMLFESFWDCSVPRFGEENAIGWSATVSKKEVYANMLTNSQDMNDLEDSILSRKDELWKTWLEFENLRTSYCWLPWRPNPTLDQTMEDCEDENRAVVFEDIAGVLFRLSTENLKFYLLCKFLNFLGVEFHMAGCSYFSQRGKNSQITFVSFDALSELLRAIIPVNDRSNVLELPRCSKSRDISSFISNVFLQAKSAFSSRYFNLLSLMHLRHMIRSTLDKQTEQKQDLKHLKKFAKSLLKENTSRNCLFLWTEYIFIEWISGNRTVSEDTFENLLLASGSYNVDDDQYAQVTNFAASCVEIFSEMQHLKNSVMRHDKRKKLVWFITYACAKGEYVKWQSGVDVSPTMVLKASTALRAAVDKECLVLSDASSIECKCLDPNLFVVVDYIKCLMYLQYFGQTAESATLVFRETLESLSKKFKETPPIVRQVEEQLYVSYCQLMNFHTWNSGSPLGIYRSLLFEAVEKFPTNACLLHLLASLKSASAVIGQIRRFFHRLVNNTVDLSPMTWLFSIASELAICYSIQDSSDQFEFGKESDPDIGMPNFVGKMTWKIRSLFEKSLQSPNSCNCVALWRAYCKFEIILGDVVQAKKIFHRSLQHCAWSKTLYLDAIQYFPEDFVSTLNVMCEKQLRIHTPVEEVTLLMDQMANTDE